MNKKGAELSMNVIIITILVVLVLVVVAVFFTGGMSSLTQRISGIFTGQLTDLGEAKASCEAFCSNYQLAVSNNDDFIAGQMKNNFCINKKFNVDLNGNGKLDAEEKDLTCSSSTSTSPNLRINCQGLTQGSICTT